MTTTNKYSRGKIYKLVNDIDDEFYVGSTCETLAKRKGGHKALSKERPHRHVYLHLSKVGWENVHIVLIEEYPCENIEQLKARERHWIDELKPSLNRILPIRTQEERNQYIKEWREQNHDKFSQTQRKWREQNKEKIRESVKSESRKQYLKEKKTCVCGCVVSRDCLSRHWKSKKHQEKLANQASTST